jgi:hypothetical protein
MEHESNRLVRRARFLDEGSGLLCVETVFPLSHRVASRTLTPVQRLQDSLARKTISQELGHERLQITAVYLGC